VVLFKSGDCLRLAIFEDFEVFFVEARNGFAFPVGRYHVYQDESDFGFDGRKWTAWSRRGCLGVKRQSNQQKQGYARETAAAKIHTGLLGKELYHGDGRHGEENGLLPVRSRNSADETVRQLEAAFTARTIHTCSNFCCCRYRNSFLLCFPYNLIGFRSSRGW
jgi:hypothetical protein